MSLDGLLLSKIVTQLKELLPCRINKIYQISETEILFLIRSNQKNYQLLISCHPKYARLHLTNLKYPTPEIPTQFIMLVRKHLEGGIITEIEQEGLDRIIHFKIFNRNEMADIVNKNIHLELMGKYSNFICTYENEKIIDALKRIPPFASSKRTIQPGAIYQNVAPHVGKKDPFMDKNIETTNLTKEFFGISPFLNEEILYRISQNETFSEIMDTIKNNNDQLYITTFENEDYFHCLEIKHFNTSNKKFDLTNGFDHLFKLKQEKDLIKEQTSDIEKYIQHELNKQKNKLIKLQNTLDEAKDLEKYKTFGNLIYQNLHLLTKGQKEATLYDYEKDTDIKISLDPKLDPKQNAKKYFQKYNKSKNALTIVQEQIDKTINEIDYFELIKSQLELANYYDALEIRNELAQKGYIKKVENKIRKQKNKIPAYQSFLLKNNIEILVGKNNLQNEYITFKIAKKNHYWFHTKDYHGAHVVVLSDQLDESTIRTAANLAACFSKTLNSSSVAIDYTQIKNLKKIPKGNIGQVIMSSYKTIYIDPDLEMIEKLKND